MPVTGRRRGFTLLELLIAIVVGGIVVAVAAMTELRLEEALRGRLERAGAAATLRSVTATAEAEWGALGSDVRSGPDLMAVSAQSLGYRAFRGFGAVCRVAPDTVVMESGRLLAWRSRDPDPARDSLLLYRPADSTGGPDGWLPLPLLGGPVAVACPDGAAGQLFLSRLDSTALADGRFPAGGMVRWFESAALGGYSSTVGWQLGFTGLSAGGVVQPVAGPLRGSTGIAVTLVDRFGAPAALATAAGVTLSVTALGARELAVARGRVGPAADSLAVLIPLDNHP